MQPHDIQQTQEIRGPDIRDLDIQQTQDIRDLEIQALEIQVKKRVNGINKLHRMATNKIKR